MTKLYPLEVSAEIEPKVSEKESVENKDRLPGKEAREHQQWQQDTTSWTTDETYTDAELARVSVLTRNLSRQQCTCHLWQASGKCHEKF